MDEPPATPTPQAKTQKKRSRGAGKENTTAHAPEHGQATTKDLAANSACINATGGSADIAAGHVNYNFIDMTGWDEGVGGTNSTSMYLERSASSSALVFMVSKWWLRLLFSPKTSYRCIIILFNDYHGESNNNSCQPYTTKW